MCSRLLPALLLLASCTSAVDDGPRRGDAALAPTGGRPAGPAPAVDACAAHPNKTVAMPATAVFYGTRLPTYAPLSPAQHNAVVGVGTQGGYGAFCSGSLIADDVVLTATHCTDGAAGASFAVLFGPDDVDPILSVDVVAKREHPTMDLALLRLASAPADAIDVAPIPLAVDPLDDEDLGEILEQGGYGLTESGDDDGRYFVAEVLDALEEDVLVVDGQGEHGVCYGDSGGPSIRTTAAGEARVVGALSWGDDSCVGRDRYARADLARAWIEEWTGATPAEGAAEEPPDDEPPVDDEPPPDGCEGATAFGACDGDVLVWCDAGRVRERPCGACGETCALVDGVVGYACVADPCDGVDWRGRCDGDVVQWCQDGALRSVDCGDTSQTCGYVGDDTGHWCT